MFTCCICHFTVELDDTVVTTRRGTTVCIRCYAAAVEDPHPLPKRLREDAAGVVNEASAGKKVSAPQPGDPDYWG